MSAAYRARQFFQAMGAWLRPKDAGESEACSLLTEDALAIFQAMPQYDRLHGLRVVRTLKENGFHDPDLLVAALLHDAGKSVGQASKIKLWHRVAIVLMRALRPGLLERVGRDEQGGWRQPFYLQQWHAQISAELARQAGCSAKTVALIQGHEDAPGDTGDPLLAALQSADGRN